jgi:hypothetical protein
VTQPHQGKVKFSQQKPIKKERNLVLRTNYPEQRTGITQMIKLHNQQAVLYLFRTPDATHSAGLGRFTTADVSRTRHSISA